MPSQNSIHFLCRWLWLIGTVMTTAVSSAPLLADTPKNYPPTRKDNVREVLHSVEIVDPYRWLEDQDRPETRAWIDAQIAYTRAALDPLPGRAALKNRLAELLRVDSIGFPTPRKGWYCYSRKRADQDLYVLYRRKGLKGPEEVLIDPHTLSADHTKSVSSLAVSDDASLLIYAIREGGADETTM